MSESGSSEAKVTLCDTDQLILDGQNQYTFRARAHLALIDLAVRGAHRTPAHASLPIYRTVHTAHGPGQKDTVTPREPPPQNT